MNECYEITACMDYSLYGKITYVLPEFEVKIIDTDFSEDVNLKFLVKSDLVDKLFEGLIDISNGQILLSKSDEKFADFA